jgi:cytochrome bd ubiquinol oxidase subunit II
VFSGFYLAFMLLLVALIFRAVAIEFRSKQADALVAADVGRGLRLRQRVLSSFLIGVAMGNIAWGVPIDERGRIRRHLPGPAASLRPAAGRHHRRLFMMHGAIYAVMKTEGELQDKLRGWVNNCIIFFIICYAITTMATLLYVPHMAARGAREHPVAVQRRAAEHAGHRQHPARNPSRPRLPRLPLLVRGDDRADGPVRAGDVSEPGVYSNPDPANSLTILQRRLVAEDPGHHADHRLIGVPVVLAYTVSIYWIFRGKVKLDKTSYKTMCRRPASAVSPASAPADSGAIRQSHRRLTRL